MKQQKLREMKNTIHIGQNKSNEFFLFIYEFENGFVVGLSCITVHGTA